MSSSRKTHIGTGGNAEKRQNRRATPEGTIRLCPKTPRKQAFFALAARNAKHKIGNKWRSYPFKSTPAPPMGRQMKMLGDLDAGA
jgi:hypothetical protein